jgi:hypothetical protein
MGSENAAVLSYRLSKKRACMEILVAVVSSILLVQTEEYSPIRDWDHTRSWGYVQKLSRTLLVFAEVHSPISVYVRFSCKR